MYRQDIPLGCEAGRVAAEYIFDMPLFSEDQPAVVPFDRYGAARGWLATWSTVTPLPRRALVLHAAALVPRRGASLDDAYTYIEGARTPTYRIVTSDGLPMRGNLAAIWQDWRRAIAEREGCPDLDQEWPV